MHVEKLHPLFTAHYTGYRDAFYKRIGDPLADPSEPEKWYWAEDDKESEAEVARRVTLTAPDLTTFLKLHWAALGYFEKIERCLTENPHEAFAELPWLLDVGDKYEALLTHHHQQEGEPRPYLQYPSSACFNPEGTLPGFASSLLAFREEVNRLSAVVATNPAVLPEFPTLNLQVLPFLHSEYRRVPNWIDGSYWGRLSSVQYELVDKFKLKFP